MLWNCRCIYGNAKCKVTTGLLRVICKHCHGNLLTAWDQFAVQQGEAVGMAVCSKEERSTVSGFTEDSSNVFKKKGRWRNCGCCSDSMPWDTQRTAKATMNTAKMLLVYLFMFCPGFCRSIKLWTVYEETGQENNGVATLNERFCSYNCTQQL